MKENHFIHSISKQVLKDLPIIVFTGKIVVVDTPEAVVPACTDLLKLHVIGVDTEARPSFEKHVHYDTSLVQMSTDKTCYLFRLNKLGGIPDGLAQVFNNSRTRKIGLGWQCDLHNLNQIGASFRKGSPQANPYRSCRGSLPANPTLSPKNCVDLQNIVKDYGILDLGLANLTAILFGKRLSKAQQLSNWEADVLSPEQQVYAATDAWITREIYVTLQRYEKAPAELLENLKTYS